MVIITGASDGLGAELAKQLIASGQEVICLSRNEPSNKSVEWIRLDLQDQDSIDKCVESILKDGRKVDALINSAAIVSYEDIDQLTYQEVDSMMKTNVIGPMLLISRLFPKIKRSASVIVNVGATIALRSGGPKQATYSTSKWALRGYTENLQQDLKNTDCRVINFLVGGFQSRLHEKVTSKKLENPEDWMPVSDVAYCIVQLLNMPKTMEISEIVINRKTNH